MAKIEQTKMTVSLDSDSKRILRNLTKAVNQLARSQSRLKWTDTEEEPDDPEHVRRLTEPVMGLEETYRPPVRNDAAYLASDDVIH